MKGLDKILSGLTIKEKKYLLDKLRLAVFGDISKDVVMCPCCGLDKFKKEGTYKGVQKYKCLSTSKIFTYKSNSVISGVNKLDKFEEMMDLMIDRNFPTLDELQSRLRISRQTAHDWRTKIMTALYSVIDFEGEVVEFDETNIMISRKGRQGMVYRRRRGKKLVGDNKYNVKVFMTYSRASKKLELFSSHMGKTSSKDVSNYLGVKKSIIVYSDKHKSYEKYCRDSDVVQKVFKSSDHISKTNRDVHNQSLNRYGKDLQLFLNEKLKGVSTKYIQGYLNWFMFIENSKKEAVGVKKAVIENKVALNVFKQKEKEFQYFLKNNGRNNYGTYNDRYYKMC